MGLANLVPGISGGTMLLAAGIYPNFIESIAQVTTFKFRMRAMVTLGCVVIAAAIAIVLLAGTIKGLVVNQRWIMYSIFIGLTLGGVPIVWKMIGKANRAVWMGFVCGFIAMGLLALAQQSGMGESGANDRNFVMLFLAGVAGASAMILPGVSGGYLLLVLGQYIPILSGIDEFKEFVSAGAMGDAMHVAFAIGLPVGLGVGLGVVGVSNLLRMLLEKLKLATLGVLLGLLVGAIVGLWPFQQGVEPAPGDIVKGQVVTVESLAELDPEDYPVRYFAPSSSQAVGAVVLILLGFGVTFGISKVGGKEENSHDGN